MDSPRRFVMNWINGKASKKQNVQLFEMRSKSYIDRRGRMFAFTLLSDLIALILTVLFVHWAFYKIADAADGRVGEIDHVLFSMICLGLFMSTNLYPGIGLNPAMEIKMVTQLTLLSFMIVLSFVIIRNPFWTQNKSMLVLISGLSIPAILSMRWLVRILAVQMGWWGEYVVVVANSENIESIAGYFHERHRLGFLPVLGVTEQMEGQMHSKMQIIQVDELLTLTDGYFLQRGIDTVLVSTQIVSDPSKMWINHELLRKFNRMIFVSAMDWLEGVSITYHDFEGMIGMEARRKFLTPLNEILKRTMDVFLSIVLGMVSLPILVLTAVLIKLDSHGPVFYRQERVGKNGRTIAIYKFRSMLENAEEILAEYLVRHPDIKREWVETQKLKEDPRITRVGRWIRKFSIDELPQLFNILKGDMSVVGPRPIMLDQRDLYGEGLEVYTSVRPGLTGFWQVSGRNHKSFGQRAAYDVYYVRNWSGWLDTYILLRTFWVVLSRDGAY